MRIGQKLLIGYLAIAVCTAVVGYLGVHSTKSINKEFQEEANEDIPGLRSLEELKTETLRVVTSTTEYALLNRLKRGKIKTGEEDAEEALLISQRRMAMLATMELYKNRGGVRSEKEKEKVTVLESKIDALLLNSENMLRLINAGVSDKELLELKEAFEKDEKSLIQTIDESLHVLNAEFVQDEHNLIRTINKTSRMITFLSLVTVLTALAGGIAIAVPTSRRIRNLQQAAEQIGKGDLGAVIKIDSTDELGMLAASLNDMASSLQQSRSEFISAGIYLSDIIHSLNESLIVVSPTGVVEMANVATFTMLGTEEELVGQPFTRILAESPLAELVDKGVIRGEEKTYIREDGREIPVSFSGSVMWKADGQMQGIVCVAHDISENKRSEEQLRIFSEELQVSNNEIRDFAYIVSHDLRAPLVNIKGFSAELRGGVEEAAGLIEKITPLLEERDRKRITEIFREDVPEAMEFINASVNRMDHLIGAILKLSRLGHQELKPEQIDLEELVRNVLNTLAHQLESRSVQVVVGDLPKISVDRMAIGQIIGNLLDNAVKYLSPDRPGKLEISYEPGDLEATIHIRDNGRGIAADDMEKVFEIFRRAGRQDVPGEGMGLAYVKALVKRLGGRIWCESEPGMGSRFSIAIPYGENSVGHKKQMNREGYSETAA